MDCSVWSRRCPQAHRRLAERMTRCSGVVDRRPPHRGNRAHARFQTASTGQREPCAPRLDERAVARRVPRSAEDTMIELERLDKDGGRVQTPRQSTTRHDGAYGFSTPMIPGAREPGMLTTFGRPVVIREDSPVTMDAATIAARQREGGGAPSERRQPRNRSWWRSFKHALW